jgi:hypothetical protein
MHNLDVQPFLDYLHIVEEFFYELFRFYEITDFSPRSIFVISVTVGLNNFRRRPQRLFS